jgi:hypothetical protein
MSEPLVGFFYDLLRDHLTTGRVEVLVRASEGEHSIRYTNPHLEAQARAFAERLLKPTPIWMWLDDERPMPDEYTHHAKTVPEAIALLQTGRVTVASLDHDLGLCDACIGAGEGQCEHIGNGYKLTLWMAEHNVWPDEVYLHTQNPRGREDMRATIDRYKP